MCTDGFALGIGVVLVQTIEDNHSHASAYVSRTLIHAESRYSVTRMEALAVFWTLWHFRDIICCYPGTVYTDHSALLQLFKGEKERILVNVMLDGS